MRRKRGFTLAELLIALAILGVIATFTIPKVLQSMQDTKYKAIAKEFVATFSSAYEAYRLNNPIISTTGSDELIPLMNYVKIDSSGSTIDDIPGDGILSCDASTPCLILHNGGKVAYYDHEEFGGTGSTNAVMFMLDPDGKVSSLQGVTFFVYTNGKVRTSATVEPNTYFGGGTYNPTPSKDPSWFSWN
jgi:prepilin-type N-terminal cleavage/methylation domain-containing protein